MILILLAALSVVVPQSTVRVLVQTERGDIELEIDTARSPVSAANFLKYVDAGMYDGGRFHRTVRPDNQRNRAVPIAVVQAASKAASEAELFPPVKHETTKETGRLHKEGTVSLARMGPGTATDHFFICLRDQPELDFGGTRNPDGQGFAAFGRVVRGMDVVRAIHQSNAEGERLTPPIAILRARRVAK